MDIDRAANGTEIYCLVDTLDEYDTELQDILLRQIYQLFKQTNKTSPILYNVYFLITSRPYPEILSSLSIFRYVVLGSCKEIAEDLRTIIQDKVDLTRRNNYSISVRKKVSRIFEEKADGYSYGLELSMSSCSRYNQRRQLRNCGFNLKASIVCIDSCSMQPSKTISYITPRN